MRLWWCWLLLRLQHISHPRLWQAEHFARKHNSQFSKSSSTICTLEFKRLKWLSHNIFHSRSINSFSLAGALKKWLPSSTVNSWKPLISYVGLYFALVWLFVKVILVALSVITYCNSKKNITRNKKEIYANVCNSGESTYATGHSYFILSIKAWFICTPNYHSFILI